MTTPATDAGGAQLLSGLFGTPGLRACFSDRARLQAMLDFEAALARAQARCGVIGSAAAPAIAAQCRAELYDVVALAAAVPAAGNIAIPLVKALTARVAHADREAAGYVHWGATSQDAIDTGLVLQLRDALQLVLADCADVIAACEKLARTHAGSVMSGRTWLQQAIPITFGLKAAHWVDALRRDQTRLQRAPSLLVLQFGGAAGTLAALGQRGLEVRRALGAELGLAVPALDWHTQRDRLAEMATTLGIAVGTLGKIARDLVLMMQTEVGELAEAHAGGSSTMPHKRNPVTSVTVVAIAERVPALVATMLHSMSQEHERGAGGWQAEWETLPEICLLAGAAFAHLGAVLEALEVRPERMRANLDLQGGLNLAESISMALAPHLGRASAHHIVESACRSALADNRPLAQILLADARVTAHLDAPRIAALLEPASYLGATHEMIDEVLAPSAAPATE